jgi:hypothetical protein
MGHVSDDAGHSPRPGRQRRSPAGPRSRRTICGMLLRGPSTCEGPISALVGHKTRVEYATNGVTCRHRPVARRAAISSRPTQLRSHKGNWIAT